MSIWSRISLHERLFSRMADLNGADLPDAMQSGELSPESFRSGVLACTGCSEPGTCETVLRRGDRGIPDFCRNGAMIRRLAEISPD